MHEFTHLRRIFLGRPSYRGRGWSLTLSLAQSSFGNTHDPLDNIPPSKSIYDSVVNMSEVQFAKSFLASLDRKPVKLSSDYVADPKKYPSQSPVRDMNIITVDGMC